MFHRNYSFIFCIALILISITGCSKISKGKGKTIEQKYYVNQEREVQLGDIVEKKEPLQGNEENISIRYTVNQATLYNNPTEASVRKEEIMPIIEYPKSGVLVSVDEAMNSPMLILDVMVTNVNSEDCNISIFQLVEKGKDNEVIWIGSPCYYSEGKDVESPEYYHFPLLPAQSVNMKIGWYINPDDCDLGKIYLTDNLNGGEEYTSYVNLKL